MFSSQKEPRPSTAAEPEATADPVLVTERPVSSTSLSAHAHGFRARERLLFAVAFGTTEDGLVAGSTTWRAHAGIPASLAAGIEAASFAVFFLALVAAPLAWLLERPSSSTFGRHLRVGLAGERRENEGAALVLFAVALAAAGAITWRAGMRIGEIQSTRVAVTATLAIALVAMAGSALVASMIAKPFGRGVAWIGRWIPASLAWIPFHGVFIAAAGIGALYFFLPASHAITPAAALVGFALGPEIAMRVQLFEQTPRLSPVPLLAVAFALTSCAALALDHLGDAARLGVLARAPYTSILVTSIRRAVDRDHDGYSPILGGGDCNDRDPAIHPNAVDVPGNGVDENCSGEDAKPYEPRPQPSVALPAGADAPSRANIVLIHVDALRPDHLGMSGYARHTSPRLDRFKDQAVWFRDAYAAAPSTRFTMSQMFTGLDVARIPQRRGSGVDFWLLPEATTLAERLEPLGYDRVGYTLSYVIQHIHDVGQGFRLWTTPWPVEGWKESYYNSAQLTTDAAVDYLKTVPQDGTKPYLLFLHYGCVHDPYIKHGEWDYGDAPVDLYDSALTYCDQQIGRLLDSFAARADDKNTAIFIFSDHGELFGEHGFTRHGNTLFQPDVRVLLLARVPGAKPRVIDTPMTLTDLAPTIEHLTGLPRDPASQAWDLLPAVYGAPLPARPLYLYGDLWRSGIHYEERAILAEDGRTKFIHDISNDGTLLLDVKRDPDELSNLARVRPDEAARMAEMLDSWDAYESAGAHWEDSHGKDRAAKKGAAEEKDKEGGD